MSGVHGHDQDHGHGHSHGHGHAGPSASDPVHPHNAPLSDVQLRVKALESLLTEKGLVDPAALDELIDTYETKVGPRNGARVVAKAWGGPEVHLPDTHAAGLGQRPQHVYSVRFAAGELWGPDGHARDAVYVDLWDDYLDPA
jgi:hypothetical protein